MVGSQKISNKDPFFVSDLSFFILSCLSLLFLTPGGALHGEDIGCPWQCCFSGGADLIKRRLKCSIYKEICKFNSLKKNKSTSNQQMSLVL